jgi:DNA-binding transcriptional LysR family regulator
MTVPDLNLLLTLDVLLSEGSVSAAARRLRLSPSAMSRALARLRSVTGDQLLVRAGRVMVPTSRAIEMRDKVRLLVEDAQALLRPEDDVDLLALDRTFTLRASDGFAETFGPELIRRVRAEAPNIRLRFIRKLDKSSQGLRDGTTDLETGVVDDAIGPEVRSRALFADRFIGAVRSDHPIARSTVTSSDYASWPHVATWRLGLGTGAIDEHLQDIGLARTTVTSVDGFAAALALARGSDLIATVPERHTSGLRGGMHSFTIPLPLQDFTISLLWHPRLDSDPAHRWLRELVRAACITRTDGSE